jgi:uncharacterized protein with PhoU and TrkA domain
MKDNIVERLRIWNDDEAADRIEELERGMDVLQDRLDTANKARADANFRANENQFKLAEAVEALQKISRHANRSCSAIAARALAELEGGE